MIIDVLRPALFAFDPEKAHGLVIKGLKSGLVPAAPRVDLPALKVELAGLSFPNPVGMAAGFDKNGEVPDALLKLGFGFTEVGTVTPRAQAGNPKPRMFRLAEDEGVINRLGFNNEGHDALRARLIARRHREGIVGVNIGANKDSEDFVADYVAGIHAFVDLAAYFTINISSPNTPGLRNLQARDALNVLLSRTLEARDKEADLRGVKVPVFLKIAPDLNETEMQDIAEEAKLHDLAGLIVSNTTLGRDGLASAQAGEAGGLSGKPLFNHATRCLAQMHHLLGASMPLIGVGGIHSGETAWQKITAGASLLQVYSALVYEGMGLVGQINHTIAAKLKAEGFDNVQQAVGIHKDKWL